MTLFVCWMPLGCDSSKTKVWHFVSHWPCSWGISKTRPGSSGWVMEPLEPDEATSTKRFHLQFCTRRFFQVHWANCLGLLELQPASVTLDWKPRKDLVMFKHYSFNRYSQFAWFQWTVLHFPGDSHSADIERFSGVCFLWAQKWAN